jgi:hypothetical protein
MPAGDRGSSPAGFRAQLLARLRNQAQADGVSAQRLQQRVAFERFLARLGPSGDWVLKGGFVLELRYGWGSRPTKDIDRCASPSGDNLDGSTYRPSQLRERHASSVRLARDVFPEIRWLTWSSHCANMGWRKLNSAYHHETASEGLWHGSRRCACEPRYLDARRHCRRVGELGRGTCELAVSRSGRKFDRIQHRR